MNHRHTILIPLLLFFSAFHFAHSQVTQRGGKVTVDGKITEKKVNTYALIIGINYTDRKYFSHLNYAVSDARLMRSTLLAGSFLDSIPEDHIRIIEDKNATSAKLFWDGFTWLKEKTDSFDRVIIYFAGHGIAAGPDLGFLIAYDAPDVSDPSAFGFQGGAIPISQLKVFIKDFSLKRITTYLITDACRNNEKNTQSPYDFQSILESNVGEIQFSSCSKNQSSAEDQKWGGGHGLFTYYFIKGLSGFADDEGFKDGKVSLFELQNYVTKHVGDDSRDLHSNDPQQIPFINIGNAPNPNQTIALVTDSKLKDQFREGNLLATTKRSGSADTSVLLKEYQEALARKSFFPEENGNAYNLLQKIKAGFPEDQYKEALQDYMIFLLNDAQTRVNKYFEGLDTVYSRKYFTMGVRELNTALGMMAKDHPLYRIYNINRLFLEAHTYWGNYSQYNLAKSKIDSAIAFDPSLAYLYNAKGLLAFENDKCGEAVASFEKAHSLKPDWWFPIYNITKCLMKNSEFDKARKVYYENLHSPDSVAWYNELGTFFKKIKSFDSSAYYYRKAIQHSPRNVIYLNNYAEFFRTIGKYDSALVWYKKALATDTSSLLTKKNIAYVYTQTRQYDKARSLLNEVIKTDSTDLYSWMYMGLLQYYKRDYDSAIFYFEKTISFDPNNAEMLDFLGDAYMQAGKLENSRNVYNALIIQDPLRASNYVNMAEWYNYNRDYDSAAMFYRLAISTDTGNAEYLQKAGENFYDDNANESARIYFIRSLKKNSKDPYTWNSFGNLQYRLEKYDSATLCYRMSLASDSKFGTGWLNLGFVYQMSKKKQVTDSAIFYFKKAIAVDPYDERAYQEVSKIYTGKKQFAAALTTMRGIYRYYPDNREINLDLASIFFDLRRFDSTLSYQEKVCKQSELFDADKNGLSQKSLKNLREFYRVARKLRPAYDSLLLKILGDSWYGAQVPDSAVYYFRLLMEKYHASTYAVEYIAKYYEDHKQPAKAYALYKSIEESDSVSAISLSKVVEKELVEQKNDARAHELYLKFMRQSDKFGSDKLDLRFGETQIRFNDYADIAANVLAGQLLEKHLIPEYIALNKKMVNMGYFRESKGYMNGLINGFRLLNEEDSVQIYSRLKKTMDDPENIILAINAGKYKDAGKYDSALQAYSKAFYLEQELLKYFSNFQSNPLNAPGLIYCYLKLNKFDSASLYVGYCKPSVSFLDLDEEFESYFALACYYITKGDKEQAIHYAASLFESIQQEYLIERKKKESDMVRNETLLKPAFEWPEWKAMMQKLIVEKN